MSQKNIKKGIVVLLLLLTVLAISGCQNSPGSEEGNVYFRSGSTGLEMRLIEDMPPHTIYEGDVLSVGVEMFNRGTSQIQDAELFVTGYDPAIIKNDGGRYTVGNLPAYGAPLYFNVLDHKTQWNEEGGYKVIDLYSNEISFAQIPDTDIYEIPLTLYSCYTYETIASDSICIDPQPHRYGNDKACITTGVSMGGSQGAPVAVNYLDVTNMRDQIRLVFSVSNVGGGTLLDLAAFYQNKCPTSFSPNDFNKVDLEFVTLGGVDITHNCEFNNPITLYNGNGKIVCTHQIGGETAYTTPVEIGLTYAYRDYIYKNIRVKSIY